MTGGVLAYAKHRGVSHASIQRAAARGRIPVTRHNGRIVIDFEVADRAWEANRAKPAPPATKTPNALCSPARGTTPIEWFSLFRIKGQLALAVSQPDHEHDARPALLVGVHHRANVVRALDEPGIAGLARETREILGETGDVVERALLQPAEPFRSGLAERLVELVLVGRARTDHDDRPAWLGSRP